MLTISFCFESAALSFCFKFDKLWVLFSFLGPLGLGSSSKNCFGTYICKQSNQDLEVQPYLLVLFGHSWGLFSTFWDLQGFFLLWGYFWGRGQGQGVVGHCEFNEYQVRHFFNFTSTDDFGFVNSLMLLKFCSAQDRDWTLGFQTKNKDWVAGLMNNQRQLNITFFHTKPLYFVLMRKLIFILILQNQATAFVTLLRQLCGCWITGKLAPTQSNVILRILQYR